MEKYYQVDGGLDMYKIDLIWRKMNTLFTVPTGNMQNTVISQQSQQSFLRKMATSLTLP